DFGLVAVEYLANEAELGQFTQLLAPYGLRRPDTDAAFHVLTGLVRRAKAFTLPSGIEPDDPAFGRIQARISYGLRADGKKNIKGWLPKVNNDGSFRDNFITSYLGRITGLEGKLLLEFAENVWNFLTNRLLLT